MYNIYKVHKLCFGKNQKAMHSTLLRLTVRSLLKNKGFSFINILGLAFGLTITLIIILFVIDEQSYDRFHQDGENIYRITGGSPNERTAYAGTPAPLAPLLMSDFPGIRSFVRVASSSWKPRVHINHDEKHFYENRFFLADSIFFEFFSFTLERGDPSTVLAEPNSVVITNAIASKYFGDADPLGKEILFDNRISFIVTGIAEDVPNNSHFKFDFIARFEMINELFHTGSLNSWGTFNYVTYLLLHEGTNPQELTQRIRNHPLLQERIPSHYEMYLQPMFDIHFEYNHMNQESNFERKYILIYTGIAIVVLLMACINFVNLSTAQSSGRALEVGMKKVCGAGKTQLVAQFLMESISVTLLSFAISIWLIEVSAPIFNNLAGKDLSIFMLFGFKRLPFFLLLVILVGIVAGVYPAFFISSFNTTRVLKGNVTMGSKGGHMRNLLVVFQFTAATTLIISSIVIQDQLRYIQQKEIGIDHNHVINIPLYSEELQSRYREIKEELAKNPNVLSVSANRYLPSRGTWYQSARWEGMDEETGNTNMSVFAVDEDFFKTFAVTLVEGRTFNPGNRYDIDNGYLLNLAAVQETTLDNPIGKFFTVSQNPDGRIIGVVNDFNYRSLHSPIDPCVFAFWQNHFDQISVKIQPLNIRETIETIRESFQKFSHNLPFEYTFAMEDVASMYSKENSIANVIWLFTILSIFVAGIGLFGLAIFLVSQRKKEIGIRKAFGSDYFGIVILFTGSLFKWVLLSNVLAWPLGYFIMQRWLDNFAYKIDVGVSTFISATCITLLISLLTIAFQTLKAANTNPIEALQYE